ncbi:aminoacyl-tRNA hydrolase [Orenia marismortui]|uniref:Peptidyl-tRNA hydrolase n=1 Tax=Orenia marismortui TaxID=46469 RepID=A0A4V3GY97_9FIRM|nr:aminoacyl-tRNA hydrolase [Orenia marismortui]TDX51264.1 peptidyl-tRNA hydrolase [Orenia marismortui]
MKLIVGLGNPGAKYNLTRHNAGFMVIDSLAKEYVVNVNSKEKQALVAKLHIGREKVILAKPQTFMNNSGQSVRALADYYNIDAQDIMVIYDDLDLEVGRIRVRPKGGHGGHNGIRSIIDHLGQKNFARLRVGIGRPEYGTVTDYVLGKFSREESKKVNKTLEEAVEAIKLYLESDLNDVMNKYN